MNCIYIDITGRRNLPISCELWLHVMCGSNGKKPITLGKASILPTDNGLTPIALEISIKKCYPNGFIELIK